MKRSHADATRLNVELVGQQLNNISSIGQQYSWPSEQNPPTLEISLAEQKLLNVQRERIDEGIRRVTANEKEQTAKSKGLASFHQFNLLWKILLSTIKDTRSRDILLIIDRLDECETITRHQFLQALTRFYKDGLKDLSQPPFVKTIIASRPDNDIKRAFDIIPTIRLRGEDEPEAISKDVELVIEDHINKTVVRGLPKSMLADLEASLIKGADRTFLWTTMVIDLLESKQGVSRKELLEILRSRDIYRIYHRLLDDSSDHNEARKILNIVVAAFRPLTLAEMSVAMAVDPTQLSFMDLEQDIVQNFEERIKALCGNFIRIVRSTVYLVHQTARQFLLQDINSQPEKLGTWQHSFVLKAAHCQLFDICLQYLALLNVRSSKISFNFAETGIYPSQFLDYAGRYWTQHYSEVSPDFTDAQLHKCIQICNSNTIGFGQWFRLASDAAHNPMQEMKEGTVQSDIAHHLGLEEVEMLFYRLVGPRPSKLPRDNENQIPNTNDAELGKIPSLISKTTSRCF